MLRACVINLGGNWDVHLPLAEFSYNNSYHSSIQCAPFEALYGRKCRSPVLWAEIGKSSLIRPELVQETTDKVVLIKEKLKAMRDHQKSYAYNRRKPLEFEILERIGPIAYRLRLPEELSGVHDTFHVSNLKKCLADANLYEPLDEIKIDETLRFVEELVEIIDREVRSLKRSKISLVKVGIQSMVQRYLGSCVEHQTPSKQEEEEPKKKESKEAPEKVPIYEFLSYAVSDSDSDLEFTARSGPKCNELEDTCETGVRPNT
ncbi:putative reverse transcriptase domain-containing protein [Tanacetum coccineum]